MILNFLCQAVTAIHLANKINLKKLVKTSRYIDEIANLIPRRDQPFVGASAFAHKGGVHVSAVMKNASTYEHIDPESVGNKRRILVFCLDLRDIFGND